jgi:3-oxoacyl-[acyl-carrier protein] reductase
MPCRRIQKSNIAFNCLALGAVETEMLNKAFPGYQAPLKAAEMASFIVEFAKNGWKYFNGKILPVAISTP